MNKTFLTLHMFTPEISEKPFETLEKSNVHMYMAQPSPNGLM
jgi:hypothetical protein